MAPAPHDADAAAADGLLHTPDARALAHRYLDIARKYTRELPALLPAHAHVVCAFLAAEKAALPVLPPTNNGGAPARADPNTVVTRVPVGRFIALRGDAHDPRRFWAAVDAMQRLLVGAARDSCDTHGGTRWTFEYAPLPSNDPKCERCAGEDIECLKTASKGGVCHACFYRKATCVRPAKVVVPKAAAPVVVSDGIVVDNRTVDKDYVDEDDEDDDKPVLSRLKRPRDDADEPDRPTKRRSLDVTPAPTCSKPKRDASSPSPDTSALSASVKPKHRTPIDAPKSKQVDAFLTVHGILPELVALVREYKDCAPLALRDAILDTTALHVPARAKQLARHLRALSRAAFADKCAALRFAVQRVLECAAGKGSGGDPRVVFLVRALQGRKEKCADDLA